MKNSDSDSKILTNRTIPKSAWNSLAYLIVSISFMMTDFLNLGSFFDIFFMAYYCFSLMSIAKKTYEEYPSPIFFVGM